MGAGAVADDATRAGVLLGPATPPPAKASRGGATLMSLPREILLRILSLVPATGLTACACASSTLASLASEDALWRRLYCARWGKPNGQARANGQWKRTYLDADGEEWEATRGRGGTGGSGSGAGGDDMVGLFLDMLRAKRDTAPDRRLMDAPLQTDPGDIAVKLAAWRRARGFHEPGISVVPGGAGPSGSGAAHGFPGGGGGSTTAAAAAGPVRPDLSAAGRAKLTFTRVNPGEEPPVYACDQNGWVHVCGDGCTEGVVDARSELLVCPVSGQTSDRLVHECEWEEEARGGCGGGGGGGGEEEAGLGVFGGGFGSFFVAGYECENERALNRLLGYKAL
ncbi:hypothetical protein GPECTOR_68g353 [Gonium pectorale]|uniref:F-box domain-containing protein n=1 Tax=Gonium pectorale TaxID=33097 RepID=A0A150G3D0_GONPE|nr:hypothetical protein GPECTOR_68g353 [Gonium pectorale]|eukprot:KXZ44382.1 hypothetical protein GPECTOR_68g353 [Gonium pectorale]